MSFVTPLRLAATFGFLAVAFGAFGAHAWKPTLAAHGTAATWETATLYHLTHAVVLLVLARGTVKAPRAAFVLFTIGIVIFSGSLYVLALTNVKWLGAITPLGGLALLAGWLALACERMGHSFRG